MDRLLCATLPRTSGQLPLAPVMRPVRNMERIRVEQHTGTGTLWMFGWLFTIGLLHLTFWKGVLGILLWPYYLGVAFSALAPH